jgi:RimJ/RimL family protein N-acetyltransferase
MVDSSVAPIRRGRHVTVRPLHPGDYGPLFEIALFTDAGSRWRLHGEAPTQDRFLELLLKDARVTFAIEQNSDGRVLGMVQLWLYDPLSRNGHITAFLHPQVQGRGWPLEGILIFIDYVFNAFNLYKLYFESLEDEYRMYGSMVGPVLRHEGRLREHKWRFGRLVDLHILALYEEDVTKLTRFLKSAEPENSSEELARSAQRDMPTRLVIDVAED